MLGKDLESAKGCLNLVLLTMGVNYKGPLWYLIHLLLFQVEENSIIIVLYVLSEKPLEDSGCGLFVFPGQLDVAFANGQTLIRIEVYLFRNVIEPK